MRSPAPRFRSRILLIALLGLCFFAPLLFLASFPADFAPPLEHKDLVGEVSRHSSDALKLNSVEQEAGEGLKEPEGIVFKEKDFHEPVDGSTASDESIKIVVAANGSRSSGSGALGTSGSEFADGGGEELQKQHAVTSDGKTLQKDGVSNPTTVREQNGRTQPRPVSTEKIWQMEDQTIMAKAYLHFAPPNSNSRLVRELKLRIRENQRILSQASKDSDLSRSALQKMRAMEDTLSKAKEAYPDCSAMASKLRAMSLNTEEQLRAQKNQVSYLTQLAASTFPKGLHCLSMRLTTEYFSLHPEERKLPSESKVQEADIYHYAIFSDNVLACAVVVNSTVTTSVDPEKIFFHVVTDSLNYPAMMMWFLMNPPGQATIKIESLDDFKWLPSDYSSMFKQAGVREPRYTSALNHLRFYLPNVFPYLDKVLLLDHDVVVQKDLRGLWDVDMHGKVIGVVETCTKGDSSHRLETLVDFSDPAIPKTFDPKACIWAFGMNMFDLQEWWRRGLSKAYDKWFQVGKRRQPWKAGSLPLGQLVFYNHTVALDRRWHVLGLGQDASVGRSEIERAAVIHYSGNMKPWLEIGIPKYRGYWNKFLKYDLPYLQQCNIHA